MELRPKHETPPWAPTNRGHGITYWPMRHHHEILPRDSWNYGLTTQKIMFLQPTQGHYTYQFHFNLCNQPSHSFYMPRSCQTHQFQPINHSIHAKSLISCFNIVIQPNMWQASKNREENRTRAHPRPVLAQAERPRSSERVLSLRRAPFA